MEIDQVLLVREAERRQRRDGGDYLRLQLGDRTGAVVCMVWEELGEVEELARAGAAGAGRVAATPCTRASARRSTCAGWRPPTRRASTPRTCSTVPRAAVEQMEGEVRELLETIQEPHLRMLLERVFGEDSELWAALPRRAGGEVLPPGLPARPARALPRRRPGGERDQRDLPGHRPRRRGHRRAAARHRQARGLHRRSAEHRPDRRRPAAR